MTLSIVNELNFGFGRSLPSILQTEATECGLACLTMVARFHGHDVDLPSLRRRFSTSLKGSTLARLMTMATDLGFTSRPLRLELDDLENLRTPCIVHWDMNHFVVLKHVSRRHIVIHDPARGICKLTRAEVSKHFTGVALELAPHADFQPVKQRQAISLRALGGRARGTARALAVVLGLALAIEVAAIAGPFFMQWVLDQVLVSADRSLLTLLVVVFTLVTAFSAVLTAARAWSVTWISSALYVQWSTNLFGHLLRLPLDWFGKRHIGDVVSRFGSVQTLQQTLTASFTTTLLDGLMSVVTLGFMYLYSALLATLVASAFGLYAIARWCIFSPLRQAQEEQLSCTARQQSEMMQSIRGIQPIKIANKQVERLARYANATVEATNRSITVQKIGIVFEAFNQLLFGFLRVGLIALGAKLVLSGSFSAGMLVAFLAYADQFTSRGTSLIDKLVDLRMLFLHAERIADIALAAPETNTVDPFQGEITSLGIELQNVSFRYAEGEPWILRNCSMHIKAGESVAIMGPSGSGKSTLARILLGLVQPTDGMVLVGGVDIRRLGLERYRALVGAVMQDDQLFEGSIADNIAFFDVEATPTKIQAMAHLASIHEEIAAMPMGYNSLVGDMGSALSGGQKQRIWLARALYRQPKILVMDEATSHLDVASERVINKAIAQSGSTRIIIAHRPETAASADRIVTLVGGCIEPAGAQAKVITLNAAADFRGLGEHRICAEQS